MKKTCYDIFKIKDIVNKYITHSIKTLNDGKLSWELHSFPQTPKSKNNHKDAKSNHGLSH